MHIKVFWLRAHAHFFPTHSARNFYGIQFYFGFFLRTLQVLFGRKKEKNGITLGQALGKLQLRLETGTEPSLRTHLSCSTQKAQTNSALHVNGYFVADERRCPLYKLFVRQAVPIH